MTVLTPIRATVVVAAEPEVVFEYFVDPLLIVRWMGSEATLEPFSGGGFVLSVEGTEVRGRFVEVERPRRIVFTWGFDGSAVLPPASSVVEVTLTPEGGRTRVDLVHRALPEEMIDRHRTGWRHFLGRLGPAVPGTDGSIGDG